VMSDKCQGKNKKRYSRSVTGVLGRFSGPVRRTPTGPQTVSPTYGSSGDQLFAFSMFIFVLCIWMSTSVPDCSMRAF
jgi:hypothetical protein